MNYYVLVDEQGIIVSVFQTPATLGENDLIDYGLKIYPIETYDESLLNQNWNLLKEESMSQ